MTELDGSHLCTLMIYNINSCRIWCTSYTGVFNINFYVYLTQIPVVCSDYPVTSYTVTLRKNNSSMNFSLLIPATSTNLHDSHVTLTLRDPQIVRNKVYLLSIVAENDVGPSKFSQEIRISKWEHDELYMHVCVCMHEQMIVCLLGDHSTSIHAINSFMHHQIHSFMNLMNRMSWPQRNKLA